VPKAIELVVTRLVASMSGLVTLDTGNDVWDVSLNVTVENVDVRTEAPVQLSSRLLKGTVNLSSLE